MPGDNSHTTYSAFTIRGRQREPLNTISTIASSRSQPFLRSNAPSPITPSPFTQPNASPLVLFPSSSNERDGFNDSDDDLDFDTDETDTNTFAQRLGGTPFASPPPKRPIFRSPSAQSPRTHSRTVPIEDPEGGGLFLSTPLKAPVPARPALFPVNNMVAPQPQQARKRKPTTPATVTPTNTIGASATRTTTPLHTTSSGTFGLDRLAPLPAPQFNPAGASTPPSRPLFDADDFMQDQTQTMRTLRIGDRGTSSSFEDDDDDDGGTSFVAAISEEGRITKRRTRSRQLSSDLRDNIVPQPISQLAFPSKNVTHLPGSDTPRSPVSSISASSSDLGSPHRPQGRRRMSTDKSRRDRSNARTSGGRLRLHPAPPATSQPPRAQRLKAEGSATIFFGPIIPSAKDEDVPIHPVPQNEQINRPGLIARHSYGGSQSSFAWTKQPSSRPSPPPAQAPHPVSSPRPVVDVEEDMFFSSSSSCSGAAASADASFGMGDISFSVFGAGESPSPRRPARPPKGIPKKYRPRDSGICLSEDEAASFFNAQSREVLMPRASTSVSTVQSGQSDMSGLVTPVLGSGEHGNWPLLRPAPSHDELSPPDVDALIMRALAAGARDASGGVPAVGAGGEQRKKAPGTPQKKPRTTFVGTSRPWQSAMAGGKIGLSFIGAAPGEEEEEENMHVDVNVEPNTDVKKKKKKPRASLPAALLGEKGSRRLSGLPLFGKHESVAPSEDEESEWSPSAPKDGRYSYLGLGKPKGDSTTGKPNRWLLRRSSSGHFESGNESTGSAGTPTRKSHGWPTANRLSQFSISPNKNRLSQFSLSPSNKNRLSTFSISPSRQSTSSNTSGASTITANSPLKLRGLSGLKALRARQSSAELFGEYVDVAPLGAEEIMAAEEQASPTLRNAAAPKRVMMPPPPVPVAATHAPPPMTRVRMSSMSGQEHRPGFFEREFAEVDDLGSGEFGKVMKVRRKAARGVEVYAVKKSRQFEGSRQRIRIREEVDVLRHLTHSAATLPGARHPNVLSYVDSWEQDEKLYIQTELCEYGNFARFLWEFGRAYPKLDEARVWKVLAELSHGLAFIHSNGVIHLDLKPANVFITAEGQFKIGDFGMATMWPRPRPKASRDSLFGKEVMREAGFDREGDKVYLAAEVLQGRYGPEADVFSLGMIMLETASNIVVPDQGEYWHRLRREDFSQVDGLSGSPELFGLIKDMMRADPRERLTAGAVHAHEVVARVRAATDREARTLRLRGESAFGASPLARAPDGFLEEVLGKGMSAGAPPAASSLIMPPPPSASGAGCPSLPPLEFGEEDEFAMDLSA